MTPETWQHIIRAIEAREQIDFAPQHCRAVGGGDINAAFIIGDASRHYFVKINDACYLAMMTAERENLDRLRQANALRVPRPVAVGTAADRAFLALEYCSMRPQGDYRELARGLIQLHRHESPDGRYGWHCDNFIGTSPQYNTWHDSWQVFWLERRLKPQIRMAYDKGHTTLKPLAARLVARLPDIWGDYRPVPSLLHGDLWGGNAAFLESGEPIIYDPASYYGDRETDLALTRLFGGFAPEFHQEYEQLWPLEPGSEARQRLYNLYHLLNHLNLFGSSYLARCCNTIKSLL